MSVPVVIRYLGTGEALVVGVPRAAIDTLSKLTGRYRWDDRGGWIVPVEWAAGIAGWARARGRPVEVIGEPEPGA